MNDKNDKINEIILGWEFKRTLIHAMRDRLKLIFKIEVDSWDKYIRFYYNIFFIGLHEYHRVSVLSIWEKTSSFDLFLFILERITLHITHLPTKNVIITISPIMCWFFKIKTHWSPHTPNYFDSLFGCGDQKLIWILIWTTCVLAPIYPRVVIHYIFTLYLTINCNLSFLSYILLFTVM